MPRIPPAPKTLILLTVPEPIVDDTGIFDYLKKSAPDGRVYTEDGAHVNNPPEWVLEQAESLSNQMKKTVKYEGQPKKRGRPTKKVEDNGDDQPDGSVD